MDIENRNSSEPEVLCIDSKEQCLVIERKTCVWPKNAIEKHRAEHVFYDQLFLEFKNVCNDYPYSLYIAEPNSIDHSELKRMAHNVFLSFEAKISKMKEGQKESIVEPIKAVFQKEYSNMRDSDEKSTGLKIISYEENISDLNSLASIPRDFIKMIEKYINSCNLKFIKYKSCKKILILNIVSANLYLILDKYWWKEYIKKHPFPKNEIDEIWISFNYDNGLWNFDKIYSKP